MRTQNLATEVASTWQHRAGNVRFVAEHHSGPHEWVNAPERLPRVITTLLMVYLSSAAAGCSARVQIERGNKTDSTATETHAAEQDRATVEFEVHPPQAKGSSPPATPESKFQTVTVTNNILIYNHQGDDVMYHSDVHVHLHEPPQRHVQEPVTMRRVVQVEPRTIDPRCEQLRRQHEETVRRWKAMSLDE